jgi:predicted ATPase/DNA-binding Xre family transcriptional regulator
MHHRRFRFDAARATRAANFASELAGVLHELRITHKALAQQLGVTHHSVDSWTRAADPTLPSHTNLNKLCDLLEGRKPGAGKRIAQAAGHSWEPRATGREAGQGLRVEGSVPTATAEGEVPPSNLPYPNNSFVGRERELIELGGLLEETRLLTLTGPGGIGKTRLALQLASNLLPKFPHGAWLVELAPITDPVGVARTVAQALHLREQPGRTIVQALQDYLQSKALLLLLDNCEHLVEACARLAFELLQSSQSLRILATSREVLRVAGEVSRPVLPLGLPSADELKTNETETVQLGGYSAVQLFVQRAQARNPQFALTDLNAATVMTVCQRLDGMPLAIELAAANVSVLSVEQLATRLDNLFGLLAAGSRVADPRHQTLRAAMAWSYDMLSEPEQAVFRRLSVFTGGWSLEAFEALCRSIDIPDLEAVSLLRRVADKSLIVTEEQRGETRYRMLETIRAYASERLVECGEQEASLDWHLGYYQVLAKEAEIELLGEHVSTWMERVGLEHDNFRAALDRALRVRDGVAAGQLVFGLFRFWDRAGFASEGLKWIDATLALGEAVPADLQANVYNAAGIISYNQMDYARATRYYEHSQTLARQLGDMKRVAGTLNNLGLIAKQQGDYEWAEHLFTEYVEMQREWGDMKRVAMGLCNLSNVPIYQGDYARAQALCEESLQIFRELNDSYSITVLAEYLGLIALRRGEFDGAISWFEVYRAGQLERQFKRAATHALKHIGTAMLRKGELAKAAELFKEALRAYRELEAKGEMAECLAGLAAVEVQEGSAESSWRAGILLGASERLLASAEKLVPPLKAEYDLNLESVRLMADQKQLELGWRSGHELEVAVATSGGHNPHLTGSLLEPRR